MGLRELSLRRGIGGGEQKDGGRMSAECVCSPLMKGIALFNVPCAIPRE